MCTVRSCLLVAAQLVHAHFIYSLRFEDGHEMRLRRQSCHRILKCSFSVELAMNSGTDVMEAGAPSAYGAGYDQGWNEEISTKKEDVESGDDPKIWSKSLLVKTREEAGPLTPRQRARRERYHQVQVLHPLHKPQNP